MAKKHHSSTSSIRLLRFLLPATVVLCGLNTAVHGGGADLIHETCKGTSDYRLCVSSLESDPASSHASDAIGLARIMAGVGIANANATRAYIVSTLVGGGGGETGKRRLLGNCADRYSFAVEALRASISDMGAEMYDNAYMGVMAAADYANACHNGFITHKGLAGDYPDQLGAGEKGLKGICGVLLEMLVPLIPFSL